MGARSWAVAAVAAVAVAQVGCVSECHRTHAVARERGPDCDLPSACRNAVHVFLISGVTPTTTCGTGALRLELAQNGFAKVGVGGVASGFCVVKEVEAVRACDPGAKFVLIGYDLGGGAAACAARDLAAKGIPVDALVLLDPLACTETVPARTLLVTSGRTECRVPHAARVVVPDATHARLPAHPLTVAAVTDLLRDVAASGFVEPGDPVPAWGYPHAPEMRPPAVARGDGWDFLTDDRRVPGSLLAPAEGGPAPGAGPGPAAGAVTIRP